MQYCSIDHQDAYKHLLTQPAWEEAFDFLHSLTRQSALGKHELRGSDMFGVVMRYDTKPVSDCRFENHRRYVDLQYVITGGELIDWCGVNQLERDGEYDSEKDFQFYKPTESLTRVHLSSGRFGIFFGEDGHRPQINDGVSKEVFKAVVKIDRSIIE